MRTIALEYKVLAFSGVGTWKTGVFTLQVVPRDTVLGHQVCFVLKIYLNLFHSSYKLLFQF